MYFSAFVLVIDPVFGPASLKKHIPSNVPLSIEKWYVVLLNESQMIRFSCSVPLIQCMLHELNQDGVGIQGGKRFA